MESVAARRFFLRSARAGIIANEAALSDKKLSSRSERLRSCLGALLGIVEERLTGMITEADLIAGLSITK
jgi:hypothetical protein